ncbi:MULTISPECIES: mechanosensitive ion channel family protein [Rhizobium]|jgi:small conductance mechanosensitive channel|uniref:Small-conductance mechanosensitive channel n=1 Tax=Rhizobium anhuiense TaxID=1184720 RepID=A0A3S0QCW8_9HYPH|nr:MULTISPECIES: mechanosensitive ion channel domain-containing protein [Rhizobium]KZS54499.1 mechanosensitive ion channel protein [Rhizobium anhuiense bv. trifolii]MBB3300662.1 small conductance mechanosensitive channel [Rhizobium sp. BK112]MBB3370288.1 small conductance mechanosensitive channel [Rhizobium sp. BK077]MBB3743264.1 small conductance mechanosensitive channel [Rhizobium sp. BK591]MBB4180552.1 small conductance mechanosensitive channel [Rhizobium sp. BK109]
MEQQAADVLLATQTALSQASALAVQYSFSVLGAVILLVLGWALAGFTSRWAYEGLSRVRGIDETLARFFTNVLRYALLILVFITVLGQFGVQTASIIAALGAAGLAIGLALQGTLQNIAAGIMLLILRPFRVGEYIETSSVAGTVREIGLFATELRTGDGLYRLAPNSTLWNTPITNFSREPTRQNDVKIKVAYEDDIDLAMGTLMGLAKADSRVLPSPAPSVFIDSIADGAIFVTLRYWAKTGDWWSLSRDMVKRVKLAFDEKGRPATLSDTSDATPTKKSNGRTAAEKQAATRQ